MKEYFKRYCSYNNSNDTISYYKVEDDDVYILDDENNWQQLYAQFKLLDRGESFIPVTEAEIMLEML